MNAPRVRIAPSPTGDPHVGTAYVALFNRAFADKNSGTFLLRIDDTDRSRYSDGSDQAIFRALRWLGIEWQEGPEVGGIHAPYRQSERTEHYQKAVNKMLQSGHAYRCFCTQKRLAELRDSQKGQSWQGYDRHCRSLSPEKVAEKLAAAESHVIRLAVPTSGHTAVKDLLREAIEFDNSTIDDQILVKSDGYPTYHLANCVDDIAMQITHVIRAEEWINSLPKHVLIYQALEEPLPVFVHVPLLRNSDKSKISKRKNPVSLDWFREQGYLPEAMLNFLANLGWTAPDEQEIFSYEQFVEMFRLEDIVLGGPVFDLEKLDWLNGIYLRKLDPVDLLQRLQSEGFLKGDHYSSEDVKKILSIVGERLHKLADFAPMTHWFFVGPEEYVPQDLLFKKTTAEQTVVTLKKISEQIDSCQDWTISGIEEWLELRRQQWELKKPQLFMPLRIALTGRRDAPSVGEIFSVLTPKQICERMALAVGRLQAIATDNLGEE